MNQSQVTTLSLPTVNSETEGALNKILSSLGVGREILASRQEIDGAWANLPTILSKVPVRHRNELMARMCIAVATGLFDAAVNYIWNISVSELRQKLRDYGLPLVGQIAGNQLDEAKLNEMKDVELTKLCLQLNLITEEGFYFLDQCRDIRNNFSIAHPPIGVVDQFELINYINRCAKYALGNLVNTRGVDINELMRVVKASKFSAIQLGTWAEKLRGTHDSQREFVFSSLHGIYCDPAVGEEARLNALSITKELSAELTDKIKSDLLDRYHEYKKKGDEPRYKMSERFFTSLGIASVLGQNELHSMITSICNQLINIHSSFNNFYNEPPFAERLYEIISAIAIPDATKYVYVESVVTCSIGSQYGTSNAADTWYEKMIRRFSSKEAGIMIGLPKQNNIIKSRIATTKRCRDKFTLMLDWVDRQTLQPQLHPVYDNMKKGIF